MRLRRGGRTSGIASSHDFGCELLDQIMRFTAQATEPFSEGVQALDPDFVVRHDRSRRIAAVSRSIIELSVLQ